MSCIVGAYWIITLFSLILGHVKRAKGFWLYTTIGMVCASTLFCSYSRYFIYPSVVLSLFPLVFFKGNDVFSYIRKAPKYILIVALLLCNLGSIVGFHHGLYENPPLVFWTIAINSILWIATTPIIFRRKYIPKVVAFISTISFEIYLVHHSFCLGHYSLANYMSTEWAVIIVFMISIALAYLLRLLSLYIINYITTLYNHTGGG